jgi:hypothetical protein
MPADTYVLAKDRPYSAGPANAQARSVFAVTPSDTLDVTNAGQADPSTLYAKALYIGVSGDVSVIAVEDTSNAGAGTARVFKAHPVGYMPVQVRRVMATGTTATNILALCD